MSDPYEQGIHDDIKSDGWSGMMVNADEDGPCFEYTVGLMKSHGHPEVVIFGLPFEIMHDILWAVVNDIRGGRRFDEPGLYEGLAEAFACATRPVHSDNFGDYLGYALWHRHHLGLDGTLEAVQLYWPDRAGLVPFEEECDESIAMIQPDLQEADEDEE